LAGAAVAPAYGVAVGIGVAPTGLAVGAGVGVPPGALVAGAPGAGVLPPPPPLQAAVRASNTDAASEAVQRWRPHDWR